MSRFPRDEVLCELTRLEVERGWFLIRPPNRVLEPAELLQLLDRGATVEVHDNLPKGVRISFVSSRAQLEELIASEAG